MEDEKTTLSNSLLMVSWWLREGLSSPGSGMRGIGNSENWSLVPGWFVASLA